MIRTWMINQRHKRGLTIRMAAKKASCSMKLIEMLEYDCHITHPIVAARIAAIYGMDVDQYNQLVSDKHRTETLPEPAPLPTSSDWRAFLKKVNSIY